MARDMDNADIYEVGQDDVPNIVCPVMENDEVSRNLAFAWASALVAHSGKPVTIYRNGTWFISFPVRQ